MADIVEQLRRAKRERDLPVQWDGDGNMDWGAPLLDDAIAEIERLRAENQTLQKACADEIRGEHELLREEKERLRGDLARTQQVWGRLHTATSELVSLIETLGDLEDESGEAFWDPELANAHRWLHYYPPSMLEEDATDE